MLMKSFHSSRESGEGLYPALPTALHGNRHADHLAGRLQRAWAPRWSIPVPWEKELLWLGLEWRGPAFSLSGQTAAVCRCS